MPISKLWTDEALMPVASNMDTYAFWYWTDKGALCIDKHSLLRKFCPALGIKRLPMDVDAKGSNTYISAFVYDNKVQQVDGDVIQDIVERCLELWDETTGGEVGDEVITKLGLSADIFEKKGLKVIPKAKDIEFLQDTASTAYVVFKNGWLEITADGVSPLKSHNELPSTKHIWINNIIPRDYVTRGSVTQSLDAVIAFGTDSTTGEYLSPDERKKRFQEGQEVLAEEEETPIDTHFLDFLSNLARDEEGEVNENNLLRIKLALGYLSHRYKDIETAKWVFVADMNIDASGSKANGGNGKSVLIKSLMNFLSFEEIDGREFGGKSDRFAFAGVSAATDICYFDDASPNFDWKRLYSKTTGTFEVRVPYKAPFNIPFETAPKFAVTSNYPMPDDDPSTLRRHFQVEVSDFYKTQVEEYGIKPSACHGHKSIAKEGGGWNDYDWSHFYNTIASCIALYLNKGLPVQAEESETFKRNRLSGSFPVENGMELLDYFISVLNAAADSGEEKFAASFYKHTRAMFSFPDETTNRELWEMLKKVGVAFKLNPNNAKGGTLKQERLSGARKQRWIDAGMSDYLDENGNNPLEHDHPKVYVFTVKPFFAAPDFSNNKVAVETT